MSEWEPGREHRFGYGRRMRLAEPRTERCAEPVPAAARAAVAARSDGVLLLQRTVGNRATGRLLQRNGHDNWSLTATDKRREAIDAIKRPWERQVLVKGKLEPAGSTLHHVLSKTMLDWIVDELDAALESSNRTLETAAKKFDTALETAIEAAGVSEGTSRKKQAWNLPFNLIAGPNDPADDPGERFDAGYVMAAAADGSRSFTESELTGHMRALEDAFREGRRRAGIGNGLTAEAWDKITTAFTAARTLRGDTTIAVNPQEWMTFKSPAKGGEKVWIRAGERRYPGVTLGARLFPPAAIPYGPAGAVITARAVSFPLRRAQGGEAGSSRAFVSLYLPGKAIKHVWERHTYPGFTFADRDMKSVNTFFRNTNLTIPAVGQMVVQSLDAIVAAVRRHVEDAAVGLEDMEVFTKDLDVNLTRVDTPAGRLFVKVNFEHLETEWVEPTVLEDMTELPDPESEEKEPEPVMAPVKVVEKTGAMSKRAKRKAKQRAKIEEYEEDEPEAPTAVAVAGVPKPVAPPTHGWRVKIKTIAPDGPAADAYTRDELVELRTTLGR
jgi:hypothetical protein